MKLSIITICFNDKEGLQRTLESVKIQTCKNFQYIVIDGASSDGTVDILTEYADVIDYSISEKDSGIYNAMNKGILLAKGKYCLFLNAGDSLYAATTIERVLPLLDGTDFVSGHTFCTFPNGKTKVWKAVSNATIYLMSIYSLSHQATFINTQLLRQRPYREDLRIVSDWEQMFYEIILKDRTYKCINLYICNFAQGGVSSFCPQKREAEREKVLKEYFSERVYQDLVHPNLLVRISVLADYGSRYYKMLEFVTRIVRRICWK